MQWFAKCEEISADFQQPCSKICLPKAPTQRHRTGMALAEDRLGSRATPSTAWSLPHPQHGCSRQLQRVVVGGEASDGSPICSFFPPCLGVQASPAAECLLHLMCHYTITSRGKGRAWESWEQGGPSRQPGTFFSPCHFISLAHAAPPEHP